MSRYLNKRGQGVIFREVRLNSAGRSTLHKANLFYIHFPGKDQMGAVFKLPGKQYGLNVAHILR